MMVCSSLCTALHYCMYAVYLSRGWMDFNAGSTKNFSLCKSLPGFTTSGVGKYPLIQISKILNFLLFLLKIEASSPKWLLSVTDEHNHISSSFSTQECSTVNLQTFHTLSKSKIPRSFSNLAAPKKSTMVNHFGLLLASAVLTYSSSYAQQVEEKETTWENLENFSLQQRQKLPDWSRISPQGAIER